MVDYSDLSSLEDIFWDPRLPAGVNEGNWDALHNAALEFAKAIVANTPKCADQSAAIRHVREALMTASEALRLKGLV